MELVDDHDLVAVGGDVDDAVRLQRLNAREDVVPPFRPRARHVELTEGMIGKDFPVGADRLLQDLLAMCDEQQTWSFRRARATHSAIVKRSDDRLARSGSRHDQVAVPVVHVALDSQLIEHHSLVVERADLKPREANGDSIVLAPSGGLCKRVIEAIVVGVWVVRLEAGVVPIGVERATELVQQRWGGHPGKPDVPLHAIEKGCAGEVGRSDVGRVVTGLTAKHPSLGVQSRASGVELDPDLRAELANEPVKRRPLRRAHIGRRDHPQRSIATMQSSQLDLE
ncbi:unannotated protein [freshwater metagenome]|uniref:Unannotated protein n=1 Tax=freshwater metagenome TaxID=449393 RepID=A0A6J6RGP8_9ZZZZ